MAENPEIQVIFDQAGESSGCPDCARRVADLPSALPEIGDDFDWKQRDYDGFRLAMMEYLAARFPERTRWTPADLEVALVEAFAAVLDQLSDRLDRQAAEAFLETARRPDSVRRLLKMIGYDAFDKAWRAGDAPFDQEPTAGDTRTPLQRFDQYWLDYPHVMDAARAEGPRSIREQKRMVTAADYANRLEEHPLVTRADGRASWSGSWQQVQVAVQLKAGLALDDSLDALGAEGVDLLELIADLHEFYADAGLDEPAWSALDQLTFRTVLSAMIEAWRMAGQDVVLLDAVEVGVDLALSVQVNAQYFQSEVGQAVMQALGTAPGGFFEPGARRFGEDLLASDLFEVLMALAGVDNVCLNRFKRVGSHYPDHSADGRIAMDGLEVPVCDNRPDEPTKGFIRLALHGGMKG